MSAPAVFLLAVAFAGGVLLAEAVAPPPAACVAFGLGAAAVLAGAAAARARPLRTLAAASAFAALALCLAGLRVASLAAAALDDPGADAVVRGEVLERPRASGGSLRFLLGVSSATIDGRGYAVRERVAVSVRPEPGRTPRPGDVVVVEGRVAAVEQRSRARDAAARARDRDFAARLRRAGAAARLYAKPDAITPGGRSANPIVAVAAIGQRAAERSVAALPRREAGLLLGVTVGDDALLDPDVEEDFRDTGLSHLLAVSGGNLAMFLGAILLVLRAARARLGVRVAVLGVATLAFMAITRFEPSVLRAGAMTGLGILSLAAGARRYSLHSLGVACLGLMIWDPFLVHSGGFQLSALATLGLVAIAPRLTEAFGGGKIAAAVAISLGAQLAVAPLVALRFHSASLVSLPANLLAVPAVGPATVLGFAASVASTLWPPAGRALALLAWPFLRWTAFVASTFARVPNASVETPSGFGAALAVAATLALAIGAYRMRRFRFAPVLVVLTLGFGVLGWSRALAPIPPAGVRIVALDVGQGDAILVRAPSGATMLVDGGPDPDVLLRRLRAHGVTRIDVAVLTHPHADHLNGLAAAIDRIPIVLAIDSGEDPAEDTSRRYPPYLARLARAGVRRVVARAGVAFALGEARVDVLGPAALFRGTDSDPNNGSVVLRVRYAGACALLSGDVQEEAQGALLERPGDLRCAVFKTPHHGSRKALREFYAATGARVALVSVGANDYGHPAIAPMRWMRELGMRVLRTDIDGDVAVTIAANGRLHVATGRDAA